MLIPAVPRLEPRLAEIEEELVGLEGDDLGAYLPRDGAEGLLTMKRAGALTLAQSEATCVVYGMPRAVARSTWGRGLLVDLTPGVAVRAGHADRDDHGPEPRVRGPAHPTLAAAWNSRIRISRSLRSIEVIRSRQNERNSAKASEQLDCVQGSASVLGPGHHLRRLITRLVSTSIRKVN